MMRGLVPLVLVSMSCVGLVVESKTANRVSDGFSKSGYAWPKTLLWHGIRSPPGSLWLFYIFLAASMVCYLTSLMNLVSRNHGIKLPLGVFPPIKALFEMHSVADVQAILLGSGLLYVSLGVNTLSDVMEAYLAGMVSIQVLLSTPSLAGNNVVQKLSMDAFQLSAVFGIAMLDSYHALNLLNTIYSVLGGVMGLIRSFIERYPFVGRAVFDTIYSIVQMIFSIVTYVVAVGVEGTHIGPMRALLITACVFTGIARLTVFALNSEEHEHEPALPAKAEADL